MFPRPSNNEKIWSPWVPFCSPDRKCCVIDGTKVSTLRRYLRGLPDSSVSYLPTYGFCHAAHKIAYFRTEIISNSSTSLASGAKTRHLRPPKKYRNSLAKILQPYSWMLTEIRDHLEKEHSFCCYLPIENTDGDSRLVYFWFKTAEDTRFVADTELARHFHGPFLIIISEHQNNYHCCQTKDCDMKGRFMEDILEQRSVFSKTNKDQDTF